MLPNLASRVSPRWLAPLGLATLGTLVAVAATSPEPRSSPERKMNRTIRVGQCGHHASHAKLERRLVEHAIEASSGALEACAGTKPFDLTVTQQIGRGGHAFGAIVEGTAATATSRCFLAILEAVEFPPTRRTHTVTTRLRRDGDALVVDATVRR